jgi:Na+-translocating ferredoxin:NAD+ oxidoreductase subunit B
MNKTDIYDKLADHLGQGELGGLPKTPELFEMFELLFTPEEAGYALQMPLTRRGEITVEDLARKIGKPVETVREVVETMARAGTVQAIKRGEDQTIYCSIFPVVPGMMESIFGLGIEDDKKRRLAELWDKFFPSHWREIANSKFPLIRFLPISQRLDSDSQVLPFEEVRNFVKNAKTLTVINCHCRSVWKKCNHILEADIVLDEWAEYLIQYRGARRWTVDEVIQRLKECEEDGLVHLTGNTQGTPHVICNCCPCCCGALRSYIELHDTQAVARTNFAPIVDQDACTLCLSCVEICPTKAMVESPEARITVQVDQCIGCGLCSTHCPENAICMMKVRDVVPPETGMELMKRYLAERIS